MCPRDCMNVSVESRDLGDRTGLPIHAAPISTDNRRNRNRAVEIGKRLNTALIPMRSQVTPARRDPY